MSGGGDATWAALVVYRYYARWSASRALASLTRRSGGRSAECLTARAGESRCEMGRVKNMQEDGYSKRRKKESRYKQ
jgi:hypothetical protein